MTDKVMTRRQVIKGIVERWEQIFVRFPHSPQTNETLVKLKGLDLDTCTREEVDSIIGNKSWTTLTCNECGNDCDAIRTCGEASDYESFTADLCLQCLEKSVSEIHSKTSPRKF